MAAVRGVVFVAVAGGTVLAARKVYQLIARAAARGMRPPKLIGSAAWQNSDRISLESARQASAARMGRRVGDAAMRDAVTALTTRVSLIVQPESVAGVPGVAVGGADVVSLGQLAAALQTGGGANPGVLFVDHPVGTGWEETQSVAAAAADLGVAVVPALNRGAFRSGAALREGLAPLRHQGVTSVLLQGGGAAAHLSALDAAQAVADAGMRVVFEAHSPHVGVGTGVGPAQLAASILAAAEGGDGAAAPVQWRSVVGRHVGEGAEAFDHEYAGPSRGGGDGYGSGSGSGCDSDSDSETPGGEGEVRRAERAAAMQLLWPPSRAVLSQFSLAVGPAQAWMRGLHHAAADRGLRVPLRVSVGAGDLAGLLAAAKRSHVPLPRDALAHVGAEAVLGRLATAAASEHLLLRGIAADEGDEWAPGVVLDGAHVVPVAGCLASHALPLVSGLLAGAFEVSVVPGANGDDGRPLPLSVTVRMHDAAA